MHMVGTTFSPLCAPVIFFTPRFHQSVYKLRYLMFSVLFHKTCIPPKETFLYRDTHSYQADNPRLFRGTVCLIS